MKKLQYIQPQTTVVRMQTVHMIAGSNEFNGTSAELNGDTMGENDGSDAASRRRNRNDWEDEEYDDEEDF